MRRFFGSVRNALSGFGFAMRNERNMRIHTVLAVVALALAVWLRISAIEWLFVSFAVALIFVMELINTAIEKTVDLAMPERHPLAKAVKDCAAAAVFVSSVFVVVVGVVVFGGKLLERVGLW